MSDSTSAFQHVTVLLEEAVARGVAPCAVAEVGTSSGCVFRHATGHLAGDPSSPAATPDTVFDLASLTKVLATTTLALRLCDTVPTLLDTAVAAYVREWRGTDREHVTVRDLLAHRSGLSPHLPYYLDCEGRDDFRHAIATQALEYAPLSQSVYSDPGFILLGFIVESVGGLRLDGLFEELRVEFGLGGLTFSPPPTWRHACAPTGTSEWRRRVLVGEVNDDNCWALGGVAGHSGLFGTAEAVGRVARAWLTALRGAPGSGLVGAAGARRFAARVDTPGSSRALGWDTMLPTSSCGPRMSPTAIGHTGFTGTSLWIDFQRDAYFVLLTNRVHPTPDNQEISKVRPAFHTSAIEALDGIRPTAG